jgi:hypothetical protein
MPEEIQDKPEDTSPLEYLVRHLRLAKTEEANVTAKRIMIEEKIAGLIPGPERGQKTVKLTDGSSVTVDRGFNYKANCESIVGGMVNPLEPPPVKIKTTRELDVVGYEWYRENNPNTFQFLSQFVVATPKKVAVSIKDKK